MTRMAVGDESGFTLVELLVVMLIIGILAEVAIPSFLGQASKAHSVAASSSLATAQTAVETYRTDHDGAICSATVSDLVAIEPALAEEPSLGLSTCPGGDATAYVLSVTSSPAPATTFTLADTDGVLQRSCAPAGAAGCHADGSW